MDTNSPMKRTKKQNAKDGPEPKKRRITILSDSDNSEDEYKPGIFIIHMCFFL